MSAISSNYGPPKDRSSSSRGPGRLRHNGPFTFGRATPATERPHLAGKRGDARYAASAPSSAISLNYNAMGHDLEPGRLRSNEPVTFVVTASAKERPFFARERHATSAPSSAISLNYGSLSSSPEPGRLGHKGPTTLGGLASAGDWPLLAEWRADARYATATPSTASASNYEPPTERPNSGLEPGRLRPIGPTTFERAMPAIKRPLLAAERGGARCAASALLSQSSSSLEPKRLGLSGPTAFGSLGSAEERPHLAERRAMRQLRHRGEAHRIMTC